MKHVLECVYTQQTPRTLHVAYTKPKQHTRRKKTIVMMNCLCTPLVVLHLLWNGANGQNGLWMGANSLN